MERLRAALDALSRGRPGPDQRENPDAIKVVMHVDVLEQRLARTLDWEAELGRAGRGSAVRAYTDMLEIGGSLPRYPWGPIYVTVDLLNPANEADVGGWSEEFEAVEVVASLTHLFPWARGTLLDGTPIRPNDPKSYANMAQYGTAFGEVVALFAEHLEPHFAFADTGGAIRAIATDAARGPVPERFAAHLWPITVWSKELLDAKPGLEEALRTFAIPPDALAKVDALERTGLGVIRHDVPGGRLFVQYRTILGGQTTRNLVEAPLAALVGLKPAL
jgi:hypothetical protein